MSFGADKHIVKQLPVHHLRLEVVSATDLINTDKGKTDVSDPYCKLWINSATREKKVTKVIQDNLNPIWNESFEFEIHDDPNNVIVIAQLFDKDKFTLDDALGFASFSLNIFQLKQLETIHLNLPLQGVPHGELQLRITPLDFDLNEGSITKESGEIPQIDLHNFLKAYKTKKGKSFSERGRSLRSILTGKITEEESKRLDQLFGVIYVEDVYNSLQTGDIILHSGKGNFSKAIQLSFASTWSHASIVIRNPSNEIRKAYNLPSIVNENHVDIFVAESETDCVDKREGGGIQLVELYYWLNDYLDRDPTDLCVLRRLAIPQTTNNNENRNLDQFPELEKYLLDSKDKTYEVSKKELVFCIIKKNKQSNDSSVFCSEFVASCYLHMGLLPNYTLTNNYGPRDFSSETNNVNSVLLKGAQFGEEKRIRVRAFDEKVVM
ncbi:hypothetical protein ABK040_003928 [Willaertia magna]